MFLPASGSSIICSIWTAEPTDPEVVWTCTCAALTSTTSVTAPISRMKDCWTSDATFKRRLATSARLNPSDSAAMLYWPTGMFGK